MKNIYKVLALLFLVIFVSLCVQCSKREGRIVAEVSGEKLYEEEFRSLFTEQEWLNTSLDKKNEIIKDWIEITLLSHEAEKRGLDKEVNVKFNIKYSKKTILANKILADELDKIHVNDDEIFTYYNLNRAQFIEPITIFKIQKFIVENWTIADSAIKLFNGGEAFYTVAKNLGKDYVVRFVRKEDINEKFWNFLSGMKKWNIRIIKDKGELNIVQLLDIEKKNVPIPFQNIKDSLKTILIENKRKSFLDNALDSLKIKYKAKIF